MRYVFFINPIAGKGKAVETVIPAIERSFAKRNEEYKIVITEKKGDALAKARTEAEIGDSVTLFACGGDGTFFEVLNGACGFENVRFGVIPCGSGNDFLRIFENADAFFDVAAQIDGKAVDMDVIKAGDTYCMNVCSLGMDAVVCNDMIYFKRLPFVSGSLAYKLSIVKTFLRRIGERVKITADGEYIGCFNSLFVACGNGTTYGGGYKAFPNAYPTDGKMDWLLVETISKPRVPAFLKLYERGEHENLPYVKHGTCTVLELEAEHISPVNLDGEIFHFKKIRFELIKNAVKFVLPKGVFEKYSASSAQL